MSSSPQAGVQPLQMETQASTSVLMQEFDWEAAVKEIDFVCQVVALTSNGENSSKSKSSKPKTFVGSRQSALDKFVRTGGRSSIPHGNSFDIYDNGICPRIDFFIILYSRQVTY